ncbi:XdhC family protein [Clostridium tagluense]|uniref:XdhC family protein n=1 Tax=Clostridium tagluense TaxID=360422 RepID=UPI001CF5E705|nr:XdhC family protein [Clostridium tagluense]MCB2299703.1 XdhC family protein [Clostridium tagluense]
MEFIEVVERGRNLYLNLMELELLTIIKNELMEDKRVCHAFIIGQGGALPRSVCTSMVIKDNEEIFGIIGGGACVNVCKFNAFAKVNS